MQNTSTESRYLEPGSINIPVGRLPPAESTEPEDVRSIAVSIVEKFNENLAQQNTAAISGLFYEDSYWRDHLGLSQELRTLKGRDAIHQWLGSRCHLEQVSLDESAPFRAVQLQNLGGFSVIQFFHTFTTKTGRGRGVARLISIGSEWKIWTMFTSLHELIGFEETLAVRRPDGHEQLVNGKNWLDMRKEEATFESSEPAVLIIGRELHHSVPMTS